MHTTSAGKCTYTIPAGEIRTNSTDKQLQTTPAAVEMYHSGEMCTMSGAVEMHTTSGVEMHHSGAGWWLAAADLVRAEESPGSAPTPSEINYSLPAPPLSALPPFQPLLAILVLPIRALFRHPAWPPLPPFFFAPPFSTSL